MLDAIARPFGALMMLLYNLVGNYGLAIILFALIVKLVLLPFQMKSKRSMMHMSRFAPKLKELEKKYAGNQQKYQQEVAKLYQQEGVNPMSGCLWSLLPFPILIALYGAIRKPITIMMGVSAPLLAEGGAIANMLSKLGYSASSGAYEQIYQSQFITSHFDSFAGLSDKLIALDYNFLGLNLGAVPSFQFWAFDWSNVSVWGPQLGLFLIPVISAVASYLSAMVSQKANPQADSAAGGGTMKTMLLIMPIMSLWIGFSMPAALGIYWICNSVFITIQDLILTKYYTRVLDREDEARMAEVREREAELEQKRQETEKLRAEGKTTKNANTSRKRIQAQEKAREEERIAALERAEKAERRARLGVQEEEKSDSQVGTRMYARGRAYVKDRFRDEMPEAGEAEDAESAELPAAEAVDPAPAAEEAAAAEAAADEK